MNMRNLNLYYLTKYFINLIIASALTLKKTMFVCRKLGEGKIKPKFIK